ncbi:MAG: glycosyltransferase family 2 protein [Kiritimatiellae bacterium]|nr:glycosyltransferase family 2 protein [Kiritimatiellia bacterium]
MSVSVIIPVYNAENTIAEALASVAAQTFRDFEVIVVDDASTDRTAERVSAALGAFGQARMLGLERNSGPARARNLGIKAARGDWLAFLDGDDTWFSRRLEVQMRLVRQRPELVLICGTTVDYDQNPSSSQHMSCLDEVEIPVRTLRLEDFRIMNPVATSTVLVRKSAVLEAGGFDENLRGPEDFDLWMRIALHHPVVRIEYPLSFYRQGESSLSTDDRRFLPEIMRLLDKAYGPGGALRGKGPKKRAQAYHLLSCAWMAANRGALARAALLFSRSILYWPFSFKPALCLPWGRSKILVFILRRLLRVPLSCRARA